MSVAFDRQRPTAATTRRAAIYVRVSDPKEEREGTSLGTQEAAALRHAIERAYAVRDEHIYREVHTGVELWERKQLQKLREAIRRREVDVVIAYAIDRLARDPVHLGVLISEADHAGVEVEFVTEPLDNSPEGQLIRFVRGYAAKVEHEKIKERTMRGRRARTEAGKLLPGGRPLYGYRFAAADRGQYEVDPTTGPVVRGIFERALRGETLRAIAAALDAAGVPTPTGRCPRWQATSVRAILRHPHYTGSAAAWRYRKVKVQDPGSGRRVTKLQIRAEEDQVPLPPGTIPPLVDEPAFAAVGDRLRLNQAQASRNNGAPEDALLRGGYARCGTCGWTMRVRNRRKQTPLYTCNGYDHGQPDCTAPVIATHLLDDAVWGRVKTIFTRPETITAELARISAEDPTESDLIAVDRSLADVGRQQRNLVDQLADQGGAVAALVREKLGTLERRRQQLLVERESILDRQRTWQQARDKLGELESWCRTVSANLDDFTYSEKRMALDALGVEVKVWRKGHVPRYEIIASLPLSGATETGTNPPARRTPIASITARRSPA